MLSIRWLQTATAASVILLANPAYSIDVDRPAIVRLTVLDDQNHPLPSARVARDTTGDPRQTLQDLVTDERGQVTFELHRPQQAAEITWSEDFQIHKDGFFPDDPSEEITLFPGAELEVKVTLRRRYTSLIRLRSPEGQPLARVLFTAAYSFNNRRYSDRLMTDESGEVQWTHGSLDEGIWIGSYAARSSESPGAAGSHGHLHREGAVLMITAAPEMHLQATRRLEGSLLQANGSPASGWLVAQYTSRDGGFGSMKGPRYIAIQSGPHIRIGADGRFEIDVVPDSPVAVFSPEGIPLFFAVHPASWPAETKQVTLRLPEVRRMHRNVLVDQAGQPYPALPIQPLHVYWNHFNWTPATVLPNPKDADSSTAPTIPTNDHGELHFPIYVGSVVSFRSADNRYRLPDLMLSEPIVIQRPESRTDFSDLKQVTIEFVDERGSLLPDFAVNLQVRDQDDGPNGTRYRSHTVASDLQGLHAFVPRSVEQLELLRSARFGGWQPYTTKLEVASDRDQTVRVTVADSYRLRPLAGLVLDPAGHPVSGARIALYRAEHEVTDKRNSHLSMVAHTDAQGRFTFAAAPDDCRVRVVYHSTDPAPLGWAPLLAVDRDHRDLTIPLQQGGSVRVVVPADRKAATKTLLLRRMGLSGKDTSQLAIEHFRSGSLSDEWIANAIQPGSYQLESWSGDIADWFVSSPSFTVDVKAGEDTIVDLREWQWVPQQPQIAKSWNPISVQFDGQPVSGAEVSLYVATADVQESERDWNSWQWDDCGSLTRIWQDLSDDAGTTRCELADGTRCVVVARSRGRLIGWSSFVAQGQRVDIVMQPTRTLAVQREATDQAATYQRRSIHPHARLTLDNGLAAEALAHAVSGATADGWGYRRTDAAAAAGDSRMLADQPAVWILEDLPIGSQWTITLRHDYEGQLTARDQSTDSSHQPKVLRTVVIEPGEGPQVVHWKP